MHPFTITEVALALFEESGDALFIVEPESGSILDANPMAQRLSGYPRQELLSLNAVYLFRSEVQGEMSILQRELRQTGQFGVREGYWLRTHEEAVWIAVELSVARLHVQPKTICLLSARDAREKRAALAQQKNTEEDLRQLMNSVSDCLWSATVDSRGRWVYRFISPVAEKLTGRSPEFFLAGPNRWWSVIHPDDRPVWEKMHTLLKAGRSCQEEFRVIRPDGTEIWVRDSVVVIRQDEKSRVLDGVMTDITERKKADLALQQSHRELEMRVQERTAELTEANRVLELEVSERMKAAKELRRANVDLAMARDQAMQASRSKSAFLANMSHELRTPLNAIIGYSEMLQEEAMDLDQSFCLADLAKIHAAGQRLLELINDLLDLSEIEDGKLDLVIETFSIEPILREAANAMSPALEKRANTLEIHYAEQPAHLHADRRKFRQVLGNLLDNACKFTANGTITMETTRSGEAGDERVRLSVHDTGIGMSSEQLDKLFLNFTQGDDSSTRKYGGTGVGLALSRRLCLLMGGTISVRSELGVGSTFTIDLPAHP